MRRTVTINKPFKTTSGNVSIEMKSTPLEHVFDDAALGEKPAKAIAAAIGNGIRGISEQTADGKRRAFNRTGKLANGMRALASGDSWEIAGPPDRLQDPALVERLRELVPALANPLGEETVANAITQTLDDIIKGGR